MLFSLILSCIHMSQKTNKQKNPLRFRATPPWVESWFLFPLACWCFVNSGFILLGWSWPVWIPGVQRRWPGPRASSFVLFWVWLQPHYKAALQTPSQTSPQFLQGTGRTDAGCKFPSSGCPEGNSWGSGKVSCFCYHPIRKCDKEKQTQACSPRW